MTKKPGGDSIRALVAGTMADVFEGRLPQVPTKAPFPVIYMADNSRLRPDAPDIRKHVDEACNVQGLVAEWPSEHPFFPTSVDILLRELVDMPPADDPEVRRVLRNAWRKIGGCDAMIAEVTPFRGVHLNPVIAFEIGIAVVHDVPIFAWTAAVFRGEPVTLKNRLAPVELGADGNWRSADGNLVEHFDLVEPAQIARQFVSVSTSRSQAIGRCAEHLKIWRGRSDRQ